MPPQSQNDQSVVLGVTLEQIVGHQHFSSSASVLSEVAVKPRPEDAQAWVVRPGSAAEISELVRLAAEQQIAVIPFGGGARRAAEERLRSRVRLYVDFRRMDHVLHLDETSLVVHVQAGLTALALEKILAPRGLSLGDYPPAALGSTIGGLLSVRTPGKSTRRHGFIEDAVLGLSAVLPDGRAIHTRVAPRRASGPDLQRALCGTEGTLGIITSAVLRVHRRPESRFLSAFALPDLASATRAVRMMLREEAQPAAMRLHDSNDAIEHYGKGVCEPGEAVLLVATAGPTDLAACDRDLARSAVAAEGGRELDEDPAKHWWRWRTGRITEAAPGPPAMQVSATASRWLDVYSAVTEAATALEAKPRLHISRIDLDGAVLFASFDFDEGAVDESALLAATATAAEEAGGYLLGAIGPEFADYYNDLKAELDPHGILNPGVELG